jgi:hypothetical protein
MIMKLFKPALLARLWLFRRSWDFKVLYKRNLIVDFVDMKRMPSNTETKELSNDKSGKTHKNIENIGENKS